MAFRISNDRIAFWKSRGPDLCLFFHRCPPSANRASYLRNWLMSIDRPCSHSAEPALILVNPEIRAPCVHLGVYVCVCVCVQCTRTWRRKCACTGRTRGEYRSSDECFSTRRNSLNPGVYAARMPSRQRVRWRRAAISRIASREHLSLAKYICSHLNATVFR